MSRGRFSSRPRTLRPRTRLRRRSSRRFTVSSAMCRSRSTASGTRLPSMTARLRNGRARSREPCGLRTIRRPDRRGCGRPRTAPRVPRASEPHLACSARWPLGISLDLKMVQPVGSSSHLLRLPRKILDSRTALRRDCNVKNEGASEFTPPARAHTPLKRATSPCLLWLGACIFGAT
jgi:hypothetical protein